MNSLGRRLDFLCLGLAVAGGVILLSLVGLTVFSVFGRYFFAAPLPGDFELVQAGTSVAVFCFLPLAQMRGKNLVVDAFTQKAPAVLRGLLDTLGALIYAGIAGMMVWRMGLGGLGLRADSEVTMILGMPVWWAFLPILPSLILLVAVTLYTAAQNARGMRR